MRTVIGESRRWSLARQLVLLQLSVVVTAVVIEAMVAVYRGPGSVESWEERQVLGLVALTEVALLVGIAGSLFLADRVRRQTFDMEPAEIAKRYQSHDAMLHAVREGLILTDVDGLIVLANDEARRLLQLASDCEGKPLREQLPGASWAAAETPVTDQLQYAAERVLMVSRSQAEIEGMPAGLVTTLRDRTELQDALHALSEALVSTDELRKQAHEHANHLQTVVALIEMREYEEAIRVCAKGAEMPQLLSEQIFERVVDRVLAARLQALHAHAAARGVDLRLEGTLDEVAPELRYDLAVIVGNLAKNAIEAAGKRERGGCVRLRMARGADGSLSIGVHDNGPGIADSDIDRVFDPRWTTNGPGRGFGLTLTRDIVRRLGGDLTARNDGGAVFEVNLPAPGDVVAGKEAE